MDQAIKLNDVLWRGSNGIKNKKTKLISLFTHAQVYIGFDDLIDLYTY